MIEKFTPLIKQYKQIKSKYKDCILLFRLGDFYEMFEDDAVRASKILNLVLTSRNNLPMCGVPYHSVTNYIQKLISSGQKVAICEQLESPDVAKGVIKRDVVRVLTPGTIIEEEFLQPKLNNYLMGIVVSDDKDLLAVSIVDVSTGEFQVSLIEEEKRFSKIEDEISKSQPKEILLAGVRKKRNYKNIVAEQLFEFLKQKRLNVIYFENESFFPIDLKDFFQEIPEKILSNQLLLNVITLTINYLKETQKTALINFPHIKYFESEKYLILDETAINTLEIIKPITTFDYEKQISLLSIIDLTTTSMGGRLLRKWLLKPLIDVCEINKRLNTVEVFIKHNVVRKEVVNILKKVADLERIRTRLLNKSVLPKELIELKKTYIALPQLKELLTELNFENTLIPEIISSLEVDNEVIKIIDESIEEEAQDVIKRGYSQELDDLRTAALEGKKWLIEIEKKERIRTGINNLRINYNSIFGYYIEVTKSNISKVPSDYIRKQTLVNAERYITEELKNLENKIIGSQEKALKLENQIFLEICDKLTNYNFPIAKIAQTLAVVDVLCCLAEVAERYNYIKPQVYNGDIIEIKEGRHPVVEKMIPEGSFVPNDIYLDGNHSQILIITGPNMSGKSTYLRQIALIVILAQMGSFVPAKYAKVGVIDRIFTRIGAQDRIFFGESTFFIEMKEVANILQNTTQKSLIILDEVGRGTSTYDGISIAWAVVEYIYNLRVNNLGPKTLFATHYFELTELAEKYFGIKNFNFSAKEIKTPKAEQLIFLHKIFPGPADKSYGIQVANIAGLHPTVIENAKKILSILQNSTNTILKTEIQIPLFENQPFNYDTIINKLKEVEPENITPFEALRLIVELKKNIKNGD